jgi:adenylate cyclase
VPRGIIQLMSEDRTLAAIVSSATDSIVTANSEGLIVTWNPAAEAMFGHSASEAIGQPMAIIVPERFKEAHTLGMARVSAGGDPRIIGKTVQVAGLRRDGSEFPVELSLSMWGEADDRHYVGIIRDVTERTEMSRSLASSEQRLQAILQSANDAIISIDSDGRVILWNDYAERLLGYSAEEMIGETLHAIIPTRHREGHEQGISRVTGGGETHVIGNTVELAALHRTGHEIPIELSLATWVVDDQRFYGGIIRDISERKKAEEELHLANKSLSETNQQLEALSAKLAKYLSRQVYDSIFEGRTEVKVQSYRKELTVFFSDIQGFTELADQLEAEKISHLLNSYLGEMSKIADSCSGTIDKFIGDGMMIFFGDPVTMGRKADAVACVQMALRMREKIFEMRKEWEELLGLAGINVRMGINTGYCTVGNFGSEDRMDYTIVGGPVNTASRLEATAAPDQIQISHATYLLVKDEVYCRPLGEVNLKGVARDVTTYEVVAEISAMTQREAITAETEGFNLVLDPAVLGPKRAEMAREALRNALAALDGE